MTKEQEIKILEKLNFLIIDLKTTKKVNEIITEEGKFNLVKDIEIVLNMLKEKDKEIGKLKEDIDYQFLCDFLINSVSDEEEPIWTEKHIEELLENFEMRWKDAHK